MVVTLGINNKIAMVEKFGTSEFNNSTGAYELDITLVDDFEHAWRTMHVRSDVFCSASLVLPDKGARQLNVGGWSLDSTQGVRLYTPDGSLGVNGTNDWQEDILGSDILPSGSSVVINVDDGTGYCKYDFKAVFEDGDTAISPDNNVCELSEFNFTN